MTLQRKFSEVKHDLNENFHRPEIERMRDSTEAAAGVFLAGEAAGSFHVAPLHPAHEKRDLPRRDHAHTSSGSLHQAAPYVRTRSGSRLASDLDDRREHQKYLDIVRSPLLPGSRLGEAREVSMVAQQNDTYEYFKQ